MNSLEMNVYSDGRFSHTVSTAVLHYDPSTELSVVECAGLFYVVDCEGDAQVRGMMISEAMSNARHAFVVLEFLRVEAEYIA